ncbi:osmoprotectant transporter permease [Spirosoma flavum]|uniref:Osmoprotectant transporter permease n=1 Tax=Spirosoma flavum TaxID=2048557 RepID=A0ABW6APR8_9BACT
MYIFWIFWGIDVGIALVLVCFFFVGLGDGTVDWDNGILWFVLLIGMAAYLLGGYWLFTHQYTIAAILLMAVLVIPGLFYGLYMLLMLTGDNNSNWK